jgi:hypothetical protein
MWNAWTAPPGALPRDYDPWSCEAHCARCGELARDCHCDEDEMNYARGGVDGDTQSDGKTQARGSRNTGGNADNASEYPKP